VNSKLDGIRLLDEQYSVNNELGLEYRFSRFGKPLPHLLSPLIEILV